MRKERRHERYKFEEGNASNAEVPLYGICHEAQGRDEADGEVAEDNAKAHRSWNRPVLPISEVNKEEERPSGCRHYG